MAETGADLPGFPTFRQAPGRARNPPPISFISTHGNEVNDEEDGIGSVIYWTVEVERRVEYKENEWLPCDESGRIDDGYGNEPNATVAYLSSLEGSREERAFELAKNEYLAWLEHKADRYTTVYGYMD